MAFLARWGFWQGDQMVPIDGFTVTIWSNNPMGPNGYSIPDGRLWERDFGRDDFVVRDMDPHVQDWYNPWTGEYIIGDHSTWQQINIVDIWEPFYQELGQIYWLEIDMWGATCGWKVSGSEPFMDDAVYLLEDPSGVEPDRWIELRDPLNDQISLDMAFVVNVPEPGSFVLLGVGAVGLCIVWLRRRSRAA